LNKPSPDSTSFYAAFAPVCFTLLGLWLIVVQTRHSEWRRSPVHRNRAHIIAVNFALPGMMGLLALVEPGNKTLWRVSFAVLAVIAALLLGLVTVREARRARTSRLARVATVSAACLYALIAVVAIFPGLISDMGIELRALAVEEILLSLLVFIAVNIAWYLMFDEVDPGAS
jgi:cytochrome bd-type quinol oxidase subunit 2